MRIRRAWRSWGLTACGWAAWGVPAASATPIEFTYSGVSNVSVDGRVYENAAYTIRAGADTRDRAPIEGLPAFTLDHAWSTIEIGNLGVFACLETTRTFVEQGVGVVGFSHGGEAGSDILDGPRDPRLAAWSIDRDITVSGPIAYTGASVATDHGQVLFGSGTVTFTATLIPAPASVAVGLGLLAWGRKRR